ncbi:class I SAM-dependent methyltransferase [Helicobacter ibis]|uniref:Class I SAM-dependent methyltransferase n=1 Tax=Helicobacter ibis TaxID=2962633 RepID=A0ABT4VEI7_9HELI|nr:class I SAM-dependent methyltransferase [Helicobacter ibis]MDA3969122.1 class I SAM-dependent methyltransferase [Helicobacter ibis]
MDKVDLILECRLCKSNDLQKIITLEKNPIGDRFFSDINIAKSMELHNVELMLCKECGQIQLSEVVSPSDIYTEEYLYTSSTSVGLIEHLKKGARELIDRFNLKEGSLIVEIGSNEGAMLEAFKELGMKVVGIDPAMKAVNKAKERGVDTICGFFSLNLAKEIEANYGKANMVIANNVIANIPLLQEVVHGISHLLEYSGVFVFETSYAQSVLKRHLIDTIYHEHISYFSAKPLGRFFASCNLELFDAEEIWTKGGSLRGYVSKPLCFSKTQRLNDIIKNEESFIFASHIVANSTNLEVLFNEISKLLGDREEFIFESFYAKAVFEQNLLDMVFLEHINYLYLLPLVEFLEKKSLNVYDAKLVESKGGSIQIRISKDMSKEKSKELLGLMESEREFFKKEDIFANFTNGLEKFKAEVRKLTLEIKKRQGSVGVYGASVGGVMMVYHLGLSDVIDYFLDDNVAKIDKYAPNLGILVKDSKALESEGVKECISVAWRFMEAITNKHKEFLEKGGVFYSLELPTLSVKQYIKETKSSAGGGGNRELILLYMLYLRCKFKYPLFLGGAR